MENPEVNPVNWYYALRDQRHGPVTEQDLARLIQRGAIHRTTLVWTAGMPDWQPLESAHQAGRLYLPGAELPATEGIPCAVCQEWFPPDEIVRLSAFWICGRCKPLFLQRLQEGTPLATRQIWRHRRLVVAHDGTSFPDRCIRCNAPTGGPLEKCELFWAPAFQLVRSHRRAVVHVGICRKHRAQRGRIVAGAIAVLLLGVVTVILAPAWMRLVGLGLVFGGFVVGGTAGRLVTAKRIEKGFAYVSGAGGPFLASLPEWTNPH